MQCMVEIREIKQPVAFLYKEVEGEPGMCLGMIDNFAQFLDVRVQIKKSGETGYYLVFKGEKIQLDKGGNPSHWPPGFFGETENKFLDILLGITTYEDF